VRLLPLSPPLSASFFLAFGFFGATALVRGFGIAGRLGLVFAAGGVTAAVFGVLSGRRGGGLVPSPLVGTRLVVPLMLTSVFLAVPRAALSFSFFLSVSIAILVLFPVSFSVSFSIFVRLFFYAIIW